MTEEEVMDESTQRVALWDTTDNVVRCFSPKSGTVDFAAPSGLTSGVIDNEN